MQAYHEARFELQVRNAIYAAQKVLDSSKDLRLPGEVNHAYRDKYLLAEYSASAALAGVLDCLAILGLNVAQLRQESGLRTVTIRFSCKETCQFEREQTREVESDITTVHMHDSERTSRGWAVTTSVDYWWKYCYTWEISVYVGTNTENAAQLKSHMAETLIKTTTKQTPQPAVRVVPPVDLNLAFLLQNFPPNGGIPLISIDRSNPECCTPSRNPQVIAARDFFDELYAWARQISKFFMSIDNYDQGLRQASAAKLPIFCPLLPVFEPALQQENQGDSDTNVILQDVSVLLKEQQRSVNEQFSVLEKEFPAPSTADNTAQLPSVIEAKVVAICSHLMHTAQLFSDVIDYIERLLHRQLIAALGQEITPKAFGEFIEYHNRGLFKPEYQPQAFAYSVRRATHDAEGELSVQENLKPISTIVRQQLAPYPMGFNINAGTRICFSGKQFIHACVRHQFSGDSDPVLQVVARARQFSSFILVLGKVASVEEFLPTHAVIVRDKDDLTIPLTLRTIPSAKEFAVAVRSLSPEQLRFVSAYRSMQLSSTLFAVCVLQIKPQLEKLLRLNRDGLTKEVELTQHLMELFIKYQIPSDLLAFGGNENVTARCKLKRVRRSVERVREMISRAKRQELRDLAQEFTNQQMEDMLQTKEEAEDVDLGVYCVFGGEGGEEEEYDEEEEEEAECSTRAPRLSSRSAPSQLRQRAREDRSPPKKRGFANDTPLAQIRKRSRSGCQEDYKVSFERDCDDDYAGEFCEDEPYPSDASSSVASGKPVNEPDKPGKAVEEKTEEPQDDELQSEDEIDPDYQAPVKLSPSAPAVPTMDFANMPSALESRLTVLDPEGALRPTILDVGDSWQQKRPQGLLGRVVSANLGEEEQKHEKNDAFDLLDALTRSGELPFEEASLHVLVCSTHCFDETVMDCLVKKNINPVEKVDRSTLVVASTVHEVSPEHLLQPALVDAARMVSPQLFVK